jgi:hypothetical protein
MRIASATLHRESRVPSQQILAALIDHASVIASAVGTQARRKQVEGAFCVKIQSSLTRAFVLRRVMPEPRWLVPREPEPIGEDIMNDATKRAASGGALSHMLAHAMAVTAFLVIAVCVFYVR